jgi:hypothetical protein
MQHVVHAQIPLPSHVSPRLHLGAAAPLAGNAPFDGSLEHLAR